MILECINQSAIIGVIGTLLGVLLGFILNLVIRIGQIKIFINKISYTFSYIDENGDPCQTETMDSNTQNIDISVNLDFHNTSSFTQKICRDIYLVFRTEKGDIKQKITYNTGKDFTNINLKPNELTNLDLQVSLNKDLEIYKDLDFYLEYKDSKGRIRKKNLPLTASPAGASL
jgi:hypothetical protein